MIVIGATGTSGFRPGDIFLVDDTTGWGHISPEAKKRGGRPFFYSETENLLPCVIQREIISFMNFPGDVTEWVGLTIILISALSAALLLWDLI